MSTEIICKGNQQGCFMDSPAHNCGCPGLKEFGEKMKRYKSRLDSPKELTISAYWVGNYRGLLREGLPKDHPENLYNWFTKTYPDLNPEFYEIKKSK